MLRSRFQKNKNKIVHDIPNNTFSFPGDTDFEENAEIVRIFNYNSFSTDPYIKKTENFNNISNNTFSPIKPITSDFFLGVVYLIIDFKYPTNPTRVDHH
jgi:hypothetical protein